jgi:hypothetical protein
VTMAWNFPMGFPGWIWRVGLGVIDGIVVPFWVISASKPPVGPGLPHRGRCRARRYRQATWVAGSSPRPATHPLSDRRAIHELLRPGFLFERCSGESRRQGSTTKPGRLTPARLLIEAS